MHGARVASAGARGGKCREVAAVRMRAQSASRATETAEKKRGNVARGTNDAKRRGREVRVRVEGGGEGESAFSLFFPFQQVAQM
jgi:hypothetical protein